jgi:hypothetical protein
LPRAASPRQASCVNGSFAGKAKIKAKLPKFVMAVPDCSQAMSPLQDRPTPFYSQKPALIVTRITFGGRKPFPEPRAVLSRVRRPRVRCVIAHDYAWRHLTLLINPWSGQPGYGPNRNTDSGITSIRP